MVGSHDRLAVTASAYLYNIDVFMRSLVWLLVLVFVVGVIYPPAAAAIACAATTAGLIAWFLMWFASADER